MSIETENQESLTEILQSVQSGDIREALLKKQKDITQLMEEIKNNARTEKRTAVFYNFLESSNSYIKDAVTNSGNLQILTLSARNLYEIHLWVRYVQQSESALNEWLWEGKKDEFDIIDRLLTLTERNGQGSFSEQQQALQERKQEIMEEFTANNINCKKRTKVSDVASAVGQQQDYDIYFKIFSKLLHPTSWTINNSLYEMPNTEKQGIINLLWLRIQLYAVDIYRIIKEAKP